MYIETKDYIIEYRGEYENGELCSGWDITLIEYPENPFMAEYVEEGEYKGDIGFCWDSSYSEDFKNEIDLFEHKIKNAIRFLNNNII